MERTEEEKVVQAPIKIVLGGKTYEVKPLVIKESRVWRMKLRALLGTLSTQVNIPTDAPGQQSSILDTMLVGMPDQIVDLVFEYAKDLNREEIETQASDKEIADAFEQIIEVAFPLARSLAGAMKKLSR